MYSRSNWGKYISEKKLHLHTSIQQQRRMLHALCHATTFSSFLVLCFTDATINFQTGKREVC